MIPDRRSLTRGLVVLISVAALAACPADAAVVPAGVQAGTPVQAGVPTHAPFGHGSGAPCNVGIPIIGGVVSTITNAACSAGTAIAGAVGSVVSGVGNSILDAVAGWLIGAATAITRFVAEQMQTTTTPALGSAWYRAQFAPIAALGGALALLVTLIALASAALRRSPDALAGTLVAVVRAGFGTGVIVALTAIGLGIADAISTDVLASSPHTFWNTVATAWGQSGFGGFGSSALAALIALVEVIAALLVWIELIVRSAVIYIAVLFFPVALAASIWPPLAGWTGRLARLLLLFVMLKPVTLIVLSLAGNAAASGLSLSAGAGPSVGTILAAVVIFALAAFAPWALMYLLSADAESAWTGGALRAGAGSAVTGTQGRSLRTGGGLANLRSQPTAADGTGGSSNGGGGSVNGGTPRGGGGGGGVRTPPAAGPGSSRTPAGSPSGGYRSGAGGAAAVGVIGGGSVAAAAGMRSTATRASASVAAADGGGSVGRPPSVGAARGGGGAPSDRGASEHAAAGGAQRERGSAAPEAGGQRRSPRSASNGGPAAARGGPRGSTPGIDAGQAATPARGGRSPGAPGAAEATPAAGSRAASRPPRPANPTGPAERRS